MDALELILALEKRLGVRIRSHEVDKNAFASATNLLEFIGSQAAKAEGPSG